MIPCRKIKRIHLVLEPCPTASVLLTSRPPVRKMVVPGHIVVPSLAGRSPNKKRGRRLRCSDNTCEMLKQCFLFFCMEGVRAGRVQKDANELFSSP